MLDGPLALPLTHSPVDAHHPQLLYELQELQSAAILQKGHPFQDRTQFEQVPFCGPVEFPLTHNPVDSHQPQVLYEEQESQYDIALQLTGHKTPGPTQFEQVLLKGPDEFPLTHNPVDAHQTQLL